MTRAAVTVTVEYERPGVLDWPPSEVAEVIERAVRDRLPHLMPTFELAFPQPTDSVACKTCGHGPGDHHKLRCEADACDGCNGWTCPRHGVVLCGCTYAGGAEPTDSEGER